MFCTKCGNEITNGASTCPECGASQTDHQTNFVQVEYKKKKRKQGIIAVFIVVAIIMALLSNNENNMDIASATTTSQRNETARTTKTTTQGIMYGSGAIGDYEVEIVSARMDYNYKDEYCIVVKYRWTNNSDESKAFIYALRATAYQDGIECSDAHMVDGVDSQQLLNEIKPGVTYEFEDAYLVSGTSDVEIEVSEAISFGDSQIVSKTFELPE